MGSQAPLNLNFFYNPPIEKNSGKIQDTRTPNEISNKEQDELLESSEKELSEIQFTDPYKALVKGFHIHVDFIPAHQRRAMAVHNSFLQFLKEHSLKFTSHSIYSANSNGPHLLSGWEVKFETADPKVMKVIGRAISWLMLNRDNLPVFIHPVTWQEGDVQAEIKAHKEYGMYMGNITPLDLTFFEKHAEKMLIKKTIIAVSFFLLGIAMFKKMKFF